MMILKRFGKKQLNRVLFFLTCFGIQTYSLRAATSPFFNTGHRSEGFFTYSLGSRNDKIILTKDSAFYVYGLELRPGMFSKALSKMESFNSAIALFMAVQSETLLDPFGQMVIGFSDTPPTSFTVKWNSNFNSEPCPVVMLFSPPDSKKERPPEQMLSKIYVAGQGTVKGQKIKSLGVSTITNSDGSESFDFDVSGIEITFDKIQLKNPISDEYPLLDARMTVPVYSAKNKSAIMMLSKYMAPLDTSSNSRIPANLKK